MLLFYLQFFFLISQLVFGNQPEETVFLSPLKVTGRPDNFVGTNWALKHLDHSSDFRTPSLREYSRVSNQRVVANPLYLEYPGQTNFLNRPGLRGNQAFRTYRNYRNRSYGNQYPLYSRYPYSPVLAQNPRFPGYLSNQLGNSLYPSRPCFPNPNLPRYLFLPNFPNPPESSSPTVTPTNN